MSNFDGVDTRVVQGFDDLADVLGRDPVADGVHAVPESDVLDEIGVLMSTALRCCDALGHLVRTVRAATTVWPEYLQAAEIYRAEHGDLRVHEDYRTPTGVGLGLDLRGRELAQPVQFAQVCDPASYQAGIIGAG
jgi:hypothetical protein